MMSPLSVGKCSAARQSAGIFFSQASFHGPPVAAIVISASGTPVLLHSAHDSTIAVWHKPAQDPAAKTGT
jgi:hypothetical protein